MTERPDQRLPKRYRRGGDDAAPRDEYAPHGQAWSGDAGEADGPPAARNDESYVSDEANGIDSEGSGVPRSGIGRRLGFEPFCPMCGYSLVGLPRAVCPECGTDVDKTLASHATVPWLAERRGWLKRYVDFWKTVWVTSFGHTRKTLFEVFQPVDFRRTRWFAWLAALHAWVGILLGVTYCVTREAMVGSSPVLRHISDAWTGSLLALQAGCVLLFFVFLAGLPTYFFHTAQHTVALQNRLVALAYLLAGPLAWGLPLMLATLAVSEAMASWNPPDLLLLWALVGGISLIGMLAFWYLRCVRSAATMLQGRWVTAALSLPIASAFVAGLLLVGVPLVFGYLFVAVHTLIHTKL